MTTRTSSNSIWTEARARAMAMKKKKKKKKKMMMMNSTRWRMRKAKTVLHQCASKEAYLRMILKSTIDAKLCQA
jgi:hypothetical protein